MHRIYLDYQATTPIDPAVFDAMRPYMEGEYGNPHSEHVFGWTAADAVSRAAEQTANLLGCDPGEVVFTSGATEANNLALQGIARTAAKLGRRHIITSAIEHKCILNSATWLRGEGFDVDIVAPDETGVISAEDVTKRLRADTALVSIMTVNNEVGTLQPVAAIAAACRGNGTVFHTDAAQAAGKVPLRMHADGIDLMSVSAHKMYGPKGIGLLAVSRDMAMELTPLMFGGGQQNGLRPGTVPTFLCVGLGAAAAKAAEEIERESAHAVRCRDALIGRLRERQVPFLINGSTETRVPHNLSIFFPDMDGDQLLASLYSTIAVSNGSACNAGIMQPSYVLTAMGLGVERASTSIRFGFGRLLTEDDVILVANVIADRHSDLRNTSYARAMA